MSQFCVIEGTKITLNNKETLPIEKIKVGQEILSFNLSTLQKAQKNDTLLKLSTDTFDGVFQEDLIKNIWKNEVEEYYSINDKLKITGDHIVLAKRDNIFYWTTVDKLLIGDYLFTEQNIFEKIDMIILIKEKVKVYNLQVNDVYNYFANSYLIHNGGAPCDACGTACGSASNPITSFTLINTYIDGFSTPIKIYIAGEPTDGKSFNTTNSNIYSPSDYDYQLNVAYPITATTNADGPLPGGGSFDFSISNPASCSISASSWNGDNTSPVYITFLLASSSMEFEAVY